MPVANRKSKQAQIAELACLAIARSPRVDRWVFDK
jgi:hypothetical protein